MDIDVRYFRRVGLYPLRVLFLLGIRTLVSKNRHIQTLILLGCVKVDLTILSHVAQTLKDNLVRHYEKCLCKEYPVIIQS